MAKSEQNSGNNTIIQGEPLNTKPTSLLMALSEIEQFSYAERSSLISKEALTTITLTEFSIVGFKYAIKSTIALALLTPPIVMVKNNMLPIFGNTSPSLFDKFFAYALAVSMPLSFVIFIAYIIQKSLFGELTKKAVKNLTMGLISGKLFATFVTWIVFNIIYTSIFTKKLISNFVKYLDKKQWKPTWDLESIYLWLSLARESIIDSLSQIMIINILFVSIILGAIALGGYNNRRYKRFIEEWT